MDPFNNPDTPNTPSNNPNTPTNPTQPNVFSVPGYYPTLEPNQFSQFSSNAFASFQQSPNQITQTWLSLWNDCRMRKSESPMKKFGLRNGK
ncbi:hypothetical protein HanIR_Chr13g0666321 [Helianthus annuus]|nr:hypothetical protein HanIR_Chr13g0666321 [Helianthus annuus]